MSGDTYQFGHFDECVSIEVPKEQITGKYCLASLQYGPDPETHPEYYSPPQSLYTEPDSHASVWEKLKVKKDTLLVIRWYGRYKQANFITPALYLVFGSFPSICYFRQCHLLL